MDVRGGSSGTASSEDNPWSEYVAVEEQGIIEEDDALRWVAEVSETHEHEAQGALGIVPADLAINLSPGEGDLEAEEEEARGGELDPEKVAEARKEEVEFMKARGLWEVVTRPEGVVLVSVRWVDVRKAGGIA